MKYFHRSFTIKLAINLACVWLVFANHGFAHPFATQKTGTVPSSLRSSSDPATIIANVNNHKITLGGLNHELGTILGKRELSTERREKLKKIALTKLLNQLVVLEFLKSRNVAATPDQLKARLEVIKKELAKIDQTLEDKLKSTGLSRSEFDSQMNWQLSWKKYLTEKLDDSFLKNHFDRNSRQFDGTELRVAHLLLKTPKEGEAGISKQITKANAIRDQLVSSNLDSKLPWDQAVKENSDAPTSTTKGEIGWIKRSGPMPVTFSNAAFELDENEVSKPVVTPFGVHLIKCLEVKQGKIGWRDAQDAVRKHATRKLFEAIVEKHRDQVKIEIR
jgi:parvulin-like peptidyl-prolyl isomerase